MLGINPLLAVSVAHVLFHSVGFVVVYGFLCCAKACKFNKAPWVYFCFSSLCFRSVNIIQSSFGSLIHLEFMFGYGIRECSNLILLRVALPFSQHHLLKRLFSPLCLLASFVIY